MPFTPLHTARLLIRPMTLDDAADMAQRRSDPETAKYQAWVVPYPVERARELIKGVIERGDIMPGEWFQLAVERESDGRIVGDLAVFLSEDGHTAEIGYTLHRWARGHYMATEAAAAMCDYLVDVLGVHRIQATTDPHNRASTRLLDRLGFVHEGTKRESYWLGDAVSDDAIFGLLAREWLARRD